MLTLSACFLCGFPQRFLSLSLLLHFSLSDRLSPIFSALFDVLHHA
jgi:hypothetical protein